MPCVLGVAMRGPSNQTVAPVRESPGSRGTRRARAVAALDEDGAPACGGEAAGAAFFAWAWVRTGRPVRIAASGQFGRDEGGPRKEVLGAAPRCRRPRGTRCRSTRRGPGRRRAGSRETAPGPPPRPGPRRAPGSRPVLTAATGKAAQGGVDLGANQASGDRLPGGDACVSCAVTAVMAVSACPPIARIVRWSAWMPAPPPLSEPAIVRTQKGAFTSASLACRPAG